MKWKRSGKKNIETTVLTRIRIIIIAILMPLLLKAQDWGNLNRYHKQNIELGRPEPGEYRVVFMGNSITEGWKKADPELFETPGFVNRGIAGQTTPQMLLRFRSDVIGLHPDLVVILAGTNDIAGNTGPMTLDEIAGNVFSMTELARSNGIEVILCSVLPAFDYPWRTGLKPDEKIPALNEMLKEYADVNNIYYLDYFLEMADQRNGLPEIYALDGVHPTKEGYDRMKELLKQALKEVGNEME